MSSKKGAFIYQQIEQTTAEWATNTTVYPASIWLFERLASGKFNMKLADGVHTFAELPAVMQDISVAVKTNNATTYILTITTAAGSFDTPNLKPQNYTHPAFTARNSGLYKITVNNQGHVTNVAAVSKADITALGIPGQDTNTVYSHPGFTARASGLYKITVNNQGHVTDVAAVTKADITGLGIPAQDTIYKHPAYTARNNGLYKITVDATGHISAVAAVTKADITALGIPAQDTNTTYSAVTSSANGLMTPTMLAELNAALKFKNITTATTLTSLSIANYSIKVTLSAASALSFASTPPEGWECMIDIKNTGSSTITQPLPNASGWQCEDTSIAIAAGKIASISVRRVHSIYVVIAKGN